MHRSTYLQLLVVHLATSGAWLAETAISAPVGVDSNLVGIALQLAAAAPRDTLAQRRTCDALSQVAWACLARHDAEAALQVGSHLGEWQRGAIYADAAAAYARAGDEGDAANVGNLARARLLLAKAEAWKALTQDKHKDDTLGWTVTRLDQHIANAQSALAGSTSPVLADVSASDSSTSVFAEALRHSPHGHVAEVIASLGDLAADADYTIQLGVCGGLLAWAEARKDLPAAELDALASALASRWEKFPEAERVELLSRAGALEARAGRRENARQRWDAARACIAPWPDGYEKAMALVRLGEFTADTDADRTHAEFAESKAMRSRMPDRAAIAFGLRLAETLQRLGRSDEVESLYLETLETIKRIHSPVEQIVQRILLCASVIASRTPVSDALRTGVADLSELR